MDFAHRIRERMRRRSRSERFNRRSQDRGIRATRADERSRGPASLFGGNVRHRASSPGGNTRQRFEEAIRIRRGTATRRPFRSAPWEHGRATGTCSRDRPDRGHTWNRCDRPHRPRARTRSVPADRANTWPDRSRSRPRTVRRGPERRSCPSRGRRADSCIRPIPAAVALR